MTTVVATAMTRIGRIREPTRSDHRPAAVRANAPSSCDTASSPPADAVDQPCTPINQTSMNVKTTFCGTTSSAEAT